MRVNTSNYTLNILLGLLLIIGVYACGEDDEFSNESFSTNEFRVLKVSDGSNRIENDEVGLTTLGLSFEVVFSHPVNESALSSGLSISNSAGYTLSFDETGTIGTLNFDVLDYETGYTLTLPAGTYGVNGERSSADYSLTFRTRSLVTPSVTLSADELNPEEGTSVSITATISEAITEIVTVDLSISGDATLTNDYTVSNTTITIPIGQLSASIDIDVVDDSDVEGTEALNVEIASLANAAEASDQLITLNLQDNDVLSDLELKGVFALRWSTETSTTSGRAIHLRAKANIPDLSVYSIGVANNGGGTDGIEYTFPVVSVNAGDDILLARNDTDLTAYFGSCASQFELVIQSDAMTQNGDDAIELFSGPAIIETFGDADVDGTGQPWEYTGSWAAKLGNRWVYGGVDCAAPSTTTQDSDCTYPLCANPLQLQGIISLETDPEGDGGPTNRERAIHLRANRDIADLSVYGIGIPNNGGGSDGREMDLPAIAVSEGDNILFVRDEDLTTMATYYGACWNQFDHIAADAGINFNGDDGVELFENAVAIEVYGSVLDDGTGLIWEYTGSWAYKTFGDVWTYAGVDCSLNSQTNATSGCPYTFCN